MPEQTYRTRVFYIDDRRLGAAYSPDFKPRANFYRYVLTLDATSPDDVFAKLNRGSGSEVADLDLKGLRSMSIGDIVYQQDLYQMCVSEGWRLLTRNSPEMGLLYLRAIRAEDDRGVDHRNWEVHLRSCPTCTAAKTLFAMCQEGRRLFMAALGDGAMTVEELLERRA